MGPAPAPRVLIVGGTGVFGSRLARMLIEDGWHVTVTSRSLFKAQEFCAEHGGHPLALERNGNLTEALANHDMVVDAAGPFQDYGVAPYRLAEAAIERGIPCLDLSDDATFTRGISTLDERAKARGVAVLSGVSSVPALSSAVVTALAADLPCLEHIEAAILPGNRAPRGLSVMQAILGQVGAPLTLWRDGRWQEAPGWSGPRSYQLAPDLTRRAALIGAPDLLLFPDHYGARTVEFRAGLELDLMQHSLAVLSWLRTRGLGPNPARFTHLFHRVAGWMEPLGTDRGGMVVKVEGGGVSRSWTLLAEAGDGPFIPAIPALITLDKLARGEVEPGARPALDLFTLDEAQAALSRLNVSFQTE
ncbi:saccharopine dehydrogenase NADP-binding domain-containing protein [Aliiroseovarius sp.]|uniref:saccharopine dehydrogenase family protein n=1 Tax=Aliiroseovarius sp. TaxID=1872442 RepID=UPI003BACA52C